MALKPAPPGIGAPQNAGMTSSQIDAWAQLQSTLQAYGFSGNDLTQLVAWAKNEIIRGNSNNQISLDLQKTPEFAHRFPAIIARQKAGLPPISVAEYLANERQYAQLERAAGLPPNFASYDALIAADVAPTEYADRINKGFLAVNQADPTVIKAFQDFYGITQAHLAAYFLDPTKATPLLEQQAIAAQIGGASAMAGFRGGAGGFQGGMAGLPGFRSTALLGVGQPAVPVGGGQPIAVGSNIPGVEGITAAEALRLAQMGVTQPVAQQGFQKLAQERQLYTPLPGQGGVGRQLTTDQLLNAQFGSDGQTALQLQLQAEFEKGTTNQGVGVGQTQAGATGVGAVQR